MVDEWNDFEVPQRKDEIRQAVHYAPPACSLEQLHDASHNSMQRWVYRVLTLAECRIVPHSPVCVSHTMALQELVASWKLDGSQFCRLRTREELFDPVQTDVDSRKMARKIMCDTLWRELCHLRFVREPQSDRATKRQPAVQQESELGSRGSTLAASGVDDEQHRSAVQTVGANQKSKRWSWNNPFVQVSRNTTGSTDTLRQFDRIYEREFIDSNRSLPYHSDAVPKDQKSSSCATPEYRDQARSRSTHPSDTIKCTSDRQEVSQYKDMPNSMEQDLVELDGDPLLQTILMFSDSNDKEVASCNVARRSSTTEEWHEQFAAREHYGEPVNAGAKHMEPEAAIVHDWLEMPDEDME
ncbi:hypothetical protein FKW77_006150 [Venturia effusa]|uniref:Uncharacterized protein n=1 Tax=Venturia effusa TaxID=50376 RepID=A0A517L3F2_9PEZI|nr:hypothetical protein FKW77_006150 [Venturia effusa]